MVADLTWIKNLEYSSGEGIKKTIELKNGKEK